MKIVRVFLFGLFLCLPLTGLAQEFTAYSLQPESAVWIDGTSNKSDWTVYAPEVGGTFEIGEGTAPTVKSVRITVPSARMESRKSTIMDRLMRKTLKVEAHPEIVYVLDEAAAVEGHEAPVTLRTKGRLTLAGVTKPIEMDVRGTRLADGAWRFEGSRSLLMTDFNLQPPSALYGALRTADEVTVHFNVVVGR